MDWGALYIFPCSPPSESHPLTWQDFPVAHKEGYVAVAMLAWVGVFVFPWLRGDGQWHGPLSSVMLVWVRTFASMATWRGAMVWATFSCGHVGLGEGVCFCGYMERGNVVGHFLLLSWWGGIVTSCLVSWYLHFFISCAGFWPSGRTGRPSSSSDAAAVATGDGRLKYHKLGKF